MAKLQMTFLFLCLLCVGVHASNLSQVKKETELEGELMPGKTRRPAGKEISAYIDAGTLSVCANVPVGEITISISNAGQTCYSTSLDVTTTGEILSYPLDGLSAGIYLLEISNLEGGYLCGTFTIE